MSHMRVVLQGPCQGGGVATSFPSRRVLVQKGSDIMVIFRTGI